MTKPSKEDIQIMADELDIIGGGKELMAFALNWYTSGQADQRESDAGICLRQTYSPDTDPMVECADAIRSQSND